LELEELSVAEVAERTGWSAVRVRVRAHRARRKLERAVKHLWNERERNR
jgi:DNA-directed RNA polymerase specialized sigma24 family protein